MTAFPRLRAVTCIVACLGVVLPPELARGGRLSMAARGAGPPIGDVALFAGGTLKGSVLDDFGRPLTAVRVTLLHGEKLIASDLTSDAGQFGFTGLRGGTYRVVAGRSNAVVRLWAPRTAPPHAATSLLIVNSDRIVRSQSEPHPLLAKMVCYWKGCMANPLIVGGVVAAAVAIPVAIHNANIDNDPAS